MAEASFDLLVVGGGITGAGVARDAALRGMRVALVEKGDFAAGTSSRSSKIIHGGVRYLEYLQFGLVRESARERRILRRIAPHLIHPLPFLYPVFRGESLLRIQAGLRLFDIFAGSSKDEWSRRLGPAETRTYLPGLRSPLKGSVLYPEFITDDARFTLANVASAAAHGAVVVNYARVDSFIFHGGRVMGAIVRDLEADTDHQVRAEVTVSAVGPWAEQILEGSELSLPERIVPSKGIHVLLDRARLPLAAATFLKSSTGRRGLAMPRGDFVYVGTSDAEYEGDLDRPRAEPSEIEELLEMTADCFPEAELTDSDVKASWAGIRPLVFEPGKTTRETSRHDRVWISAPGLVTVAGGKLTTYRPMSRRILQAVAKARGRPVPGEEATSVRPLPGVPVPGVPGEDLRAFRARTSEALRAASVEDATIERMAFLYGTQVEQILAYGEEDPAWLRPLAEAVPALRAEVRLAIESEMARTLVDVMDRRLGLLLFSRKGGWEAAGEAAAISGAILGWNRAKVEDELQAYREIARQHGPLGRATPERDPHSVDTPHPDPLA